MTSISGTMSDSPLWDSADRFPRFRGAAWLLIVAAVALHATVISRTEPLQSANDRSRWCTVWSLLNRGSYQIDEIRERPAWNTIDLVRVDGHFYSTKPPLMSTWVAGVTWCVSRVTGWTLDRDLDSLNAAVLVLVNALPFGLSLWCLARILELRCRSEWTAWFVLIAAAFGTLLSPFLCTLNNHTVAAAGVMVATSCWFGVRVSAFGFRREDQDDLSLSANAERRNPNAEFALWGFAASWAACHDLPAAAFAVWMALCAWRRQPRAALAYFLPAALLPAIAFLVVNYAATGQWKPMYSGYGGDSYRFVYEGVPSYWTQPQGIDRNLDSTPIYLLHCLVGHHGWFSLTPVFLLVLLGLGPASRSLGIAKPQTSDACGFAIPNNRDTSTSHLLIVGSTLILSLIVLGFYLTRTENYNYGGVSCGLRWALFLTPLWLVALVPALEWGASSRIFRGVAWLALGASIYSAWEPLGHPWRQPWLFREMDRLGWIDYRDRPPELPHPLHSWIGELPQTGDSQKFVELQRFTSLGEEDRLRVELSGEERIGARKCAAVTISRQHGTTLLSKRRLLIDRDAFRAGLPPAACLVWTDPKVTPAEQQADLALFRGLPLLRAYHPGFIRYLKSPLRTDALPCLRVAAQVEYAAVPSESPLVYRCDVWLCEELPFGVARVDWTVSQTDTVAIVQQESWQVVDCSPKVSPKSPVTIDHLPPFHR